MYKISIAKELFEDILLKKTLILEKDNSKYWKKELLEPKIINNKLIYSIKQVEKIVLTNGLSEDKPQMIVECLKVDYCEKNDKFQFFLGEIIEQKNTTFTKDYKDILIEKLLKEKEFLQDSINRDYLTKLYNKRKMDLDLENLTNSKNLSFLTAIFINIDNFSLINEEFGSEIGDKILIYLAQKLTKHSTLLNGNIYIHLQDFIILSFISKEKLIVRLNDLKEDIKSQINQYHSDEISISASMGVAFYSDYNSNKMMLLKAKEALNKAKKDGKDKIEII